MKVLRKALAITLSLSLFLIPNYAFASNNSNISNQVILFESREIVESKSLEERASLGINELEKNTGLKVTASAITTLPSSDNQQLSISPAEPLLTSQLLRSVVQNGIRTDSYVVKAVQSIYPHTVTGSSGILVSSMYVNLNVSFDQPSQNDCIQMVKTTATITSSGAVRLVMTNGYKEQAYNDLITTSKQIANPGQASYTLNACSSIWIHDSTGFLYLRNNLHYNNGSVTTVEFYVDRYGDKIYL